MFVGSPVETDEKEVSAVCCVLFTKWASSVLGKLLNFKAEIVTSKKNKYTLLFPQQDSPIGKRMYILSSHFVTIGLEGFSVVLVFIMLVVSYTRAYCV